jgi:hypothetical protein
VTPTSSATSEQTLVVCQPAENGVTATATCPECEESFQTVVFKTGRQQRSFCSDACRQAAYRKSDAHRKILDGLTNQRLNRRVSHFRRRNAFKSIGLDVHSGPDAVGVPQLSAINLKNFSKERDPFTPFSRKEWKQMQKEQRHGNTI